MIMKKQRTTRSLGTLKAEDGYRIGKLCFATTMGLMAFVAAVFTTTLPLSLGWRYLWLAVCVASFLLAMIGVVLFSRRPAEPPGIATLPGSDVL
jgi:membrane protein implicated in regulation of membrane protease activity